MSGDANRRREPQAEAVGKTIEDVDDDVASQHTGISPVRLAGFAGGGLAAFALLAVAVIVGCKARRRSRRRQASLPADCIGWAWRETLDRYDEAGLALAPTTTPQEAARALQATESTGRGSPRAIAFDGRDRPAFCVSRRAAGLRRRQPSLDVS